MCIRDRPNIFGGMAGGRVWGALFFVFMSFAALSTVIAVFENIVAFGMDLWGWSLSLIHISRERRGGAVWLLCCLSGGGAGQARYHLYL